jgi:putative membrane protein
MTRIILSGVLFSVLFLSTGCTSDDSVYQAIEQSKAQLQESGMQNAGVQSMEDDIRFAAESASASLMQVQLGEMALDRAVSPEVKALAQRIVSDHKRIEEDLKAVAEQRKLVLPSEPGKDHKEIIEMVSSQTGIAFDLAYMNQMVDLHKDLVKEYEQAAEEGADINIRTFASKQLPLLRQHRQMAEDMEEKINNAR